MKTNSLQKFISALLLAAFCFTATESWARLPKPIQATAVVLAVDVESKTLVVKFGRAEKPVLLDWDDKTEFVRGELAVTPSALKIGTTVTLTYKNVSFQNPLLKRMSIPEQSIST
jgi:hypothetical protein